MLTFYINSCIFATMKLIDEIPKPCLELFGQAIFDGDRRAAATIASDPSYNVAVGRDYRSRYHNQQIQKTISDYIKSSPELGLKCETAEHWRGHALRIQIGRFIIFPQRLRSRYEEKDDPRYQLNMIQNNPTHQGELFDPYTHSDATIIAHLNFGRDDSGLFSQITIPDSAGGIYESISILTDNSQLQLGLNELPVERAPIATINIKHNDQSLASGA